jgi:hypothetical protein
MARYNFKCSNCGSTEILVISIPDFLSLKTKDEFDHRKCDECDAVSKFVRIFSSTSSKISRGKDEILVQTKEEARKIVEKIKSGDMRAIRDVYGEEA